VVGPSDGCRVRDGRLALLAVVGALFHTSNPLLLTLVRLLDLMLLLQTIASSGLLAFNYSSVYQAFTLNFGWALGLFRSSGIQASINGAIDQYLGNRVTVIPRDGSVVCGGRGSGARAQKEKNT
jgi:hypothetical protein